MPNDPEAVALTGAEFKTLREDCGLSISEAAAFHDVRERTIEKWEQGGPPPGVASELLDLRLQIEVAAQKALDVYLGVISQHPDIEGVDLYRYEVWAYPGSAPAAEGLPHGAHNRLLSKTADLLAANGISVNIEYWTPNSPKGISPI